MFAIPIQVTSSEHLLATNAKVNQAASDLLIGLNEPNAYKALLEVVLFEIISNFYCHAKEGSGELQGYCYRQHLLLRSKNILKSKNPWIVSFCKHLANISREQLWILMKDRLADVSLKGRGLGMIGLVHDHGVSINASLELYKNHNWLYLDYIIPLNNRISD